MAALPPTQHERWEFLPFVLSSAQRVSKDPITVLETTRHAIILGAGLAGTTTANRLAARGWQITLIESEEIENFLASAQLPFGPGDFRRNVVTSGIRLNPLVGRIFVLDGVRLQGVRLCEPCSYLAKLLGKKLLPAMTGRCGLRARILDDGLVRTGGPIEAQDA